MDVRAGGKGSAWKLCIGLAVVCGVLVFTAGFLHRNAVASAIDAQEAKSASYISGKLTDAVGGHKPTKQLTDRETASLLKVADVPAGMAVSIYTLAGSPVFSSDRADAGDRAAIASAADGGVTRVISGTDLSVYAPIEHKGKAIAVAAVVRDIESVRAEAGGPLDALRLPLVAIGVLLLIAGLVLMVRGGPTPAARATATAAPAEPAKQKDKKKAAAPVKARVSGFEVGARGRSRDVRDAGPAGVGAWARARGPGVARSGRGAITLSHRASSRSEVAKVACPARCRG